MTEPAGRAAAGGGAGKQREAALRWLLLDLSLAGWLGYAFAVFQGGEGTSPALFAGAYAVAAALTLALIRGRRGTDGWIRRSAAPLAGYAALVAAGVAAARLGPIAMTPRGGAWLAAATFVCCGLAHRLLDRLNATSAANSRLFESLRWIALLAASSALVWPFYTHRPLGAGDAYWYTLMLADFVEQVRQGQFPVWVGATEYAFNGAVSPLRLAPWLQHFGALLDLLTWRQLDHVTLKNLIVVTALPLTGFSSYFFLRALMPKSATLAMLLAATLIASPAMLAPLYVGDQLMTFLALPFLPAVFYGLWRVAAENDFRGHAALSIGLAGLWLCHPPMGLWSSLLTALGYAAKMLLKREAAEFRRAAVAAGLFLAFGAYTFVSALSLDNANQAEISGSVAAQELGKSFPAVLLPLTATMHEQSNYQPGYVVLGLLLLAFIGLPWRRPRGALPLALAVLLLACIALPIPGFTMAFWSHMPAAVMQATNVWPLQRLAPIGVCLSVFLFAVVYRDSPRWLALGFIGLLLPALAWPGHQASRLSRAFSNTISRGPQSHVYYQKHNLLLTRYCFVAFEFTPSYFSHGYMDPYLENRLLKRDLRPLVNNTESAVRKGPLPAAGAEADLLASGVFSAVNVNGSTFYDLQPQLRLPSGQRLALWLDPLQPNQPGWLQIIGDDLHREYIYPDSGSGVDRRQVPRALGSLPSSSRVVSLYTDKPEGLTPRQTRIIPGQAIAPEFPYARYELWRYRVDDLPIAVKSWTPYRAIVRSPEPAYLETPRLWLSSYKAKVNGQRVKVERSPDNLAMIAVPAGYSDVTIRFAPPLFLELTFWAGLIAWTTLAMWGGIILYRAPKHTRT